MSREEIKLWLRSGSWKFVENSRPDRLGAEVAEFCWKGNSIFYRPGTSDTTVIHDILLKRVSQYWIPEAIHPRMILDIGGHIGTSSLYFASRYPESRIFCFEPLEGNFGLLQRNIAPYAQIQGFNVGLGKSTESKAIYPSANQANFGGYSFFPEISNSRLAHTVRVENPASLLARLGIERVDLIKIDAEGAENEIMGAMPPNILRSAQWIIGELHGNSDFHLLSSLSEWFDISVKKPLRKKHFMFNACNKEWSPKVERLFEFH